jgi:hypothetical protein
LMRTMQVERGKTRPNTMMTGHTGYITHARKILKPPTQESQQTPLQGVPAAEQEPLKQEESVEESSAEETA